MKRVLEGSTSLKEKAIARFDMLRLIQMEAAARKRHLKAVLVHSCVTIYLHSILFGF
ncbi:Uncharacterised protein [uncultured archaeon]|nr:Uncharacterised protein [uncultured archaeon]